MLNNFIFSLSIAMPVFLVMCVGYILKTRGVLDDHFVKTSNFMIFNVALPIKLFHDVFMTPLNEYFDIKFIVFIVTGTILSAAVAWILGVIFIKDKSQLGAFAQGAFRGNFLYIGLSLMENVTGSIGLKAPLAVVFIMPLYNILAVIILSLASVDKESKVSIKNTLVNIAKNPLIISIILGIIASQIGIKLPVFAVRTMGYFREVVTPLALITIGASFNLKKSSKNMSTAIFASIFKLIILPLTAVGLALALNFNNEDILLIYVLFGVPTAIVSYIMTAAMNGDKDLAWNIIMITTIMSVFTMTLFIFVFRTVGIIS